MADNLRLTKEEQKSLREKSIEINKILINMELPPYKESELAHKILELSIRYVKASKKGELFLDL